MSEIRKLCLVKHLRDEVVNQPPVRWAIDELEKSLTDYNISIQYCENIGQLSSFVQRDSPSTNGESCIVLSGRESEVARALSATSGVSVPDSAESFGLIPGKLDGQDVLLVCGSDVRGLVYAVLELADQVINGQDLAEVFAPRTPVVEQPINPIRSIARLFTSEVEDKTWFYDKAFWTQYLTMPCTASAV